MKEMLTNNVLFGIVLTFVSLEIGRYLFKKTKLTIVNPFLIACTVSILFLKVFNIPYSSYMLGGSILNVFLGAANVVLGILLFKQIEYLKRHFKAVMIGALAGCITSAICITVLCKLFGVHVSLLLSLLPKSITTPIAVEVVHMIGGIDTITVVAISVTGVTGAVVATHVLRIARINHPIAKGVAIGSASHVIGTSKAIEIGELEGAMSATSIVVCGVITLVLVPLLAKFL